MGLLTTFYNFLAPMHCIDPAPTQAPIATAATETQS